MGGFSSCFSRVSVRILVCTGTYNRYVIVINLRDVKFRGLGLSALPRGRTSGSPCAPCPVPVAVQLGSGDVCCSKEFIVRLGRFWWACVSNSMEGVTFSCGVSAVMSGRGQGQFLRSLRRLGFPGLLFSSVSEFL